MKVLPVLLPAILSLLGVPAALCAPPRFRAEFIPVPDNQPWIYAVMNDAGTVAGYFADDSGYHGFLYDGTFSLLPGIPSPADPAETLSLVPQAVGPHGEMAGLAIPAHPQTSIGFQFLRDEQGNVRLNPFSDIPGFQVGALTPFGVLGQVCQGSSCSSFLLGDSGAISFPAPGWPTSGVLAMPSSDLAVGDVSDGANVFAAVWRRGALSLLPSFSQSVGSLAIAANASGSIVGYYVLSAVARNVWPALWRADGSTVDLEGLPDAYEGFASSINDDGVVVGYSTNPFWQDLYRPWLWNRGTIFDLRSLMVFPGARPRALSVGSRNSRGWLLGVADYSDFVRAFIAKPVDPADFDANGNVGVSDLLRFIAAWLNADITADVNGDSVVSIADLWSYFASFFASRGP